LAGDNLKGYILRQLSVSIQGRLSIFFTNRVLLIRTRRLMPNKINHALTIII